MDRSGKVDHSEMLCHQCIFGISRLFRSQHRSLIHILSVPLVPPSPKVGATRLSLFDSLLSRTIVLPAVSLEYARNSFYK